MTPGISVWMTNTAANRWSAPNSWIRALNSYKGWGSPHWVTQRKIPLCFSLLSRTFIALHPPDFIFAGSLQQTGLHPLSSCQWCCAAEGSIWLKQSSSALIRCLLFMQNKYFFPLATGSAFGEQDWRVHSSIVGPPPHTWGNEGVPPPPPPTQQMAAVKTQPLTPTHSPSYSLQNHTLIPELSSSLKRFTRTRLSALAPRRAATCLPLCQDTFWTDKRLTGSSSAVTYHSQTTRQLSVYLFMFPRSW